MPFARILRKGQVTLPKKVRDILNVSKGDVVDFEISGDTVTIRSKVLVGKTESELLANIHRMHKKIGDVDPRAMEQVIEAAIRELRTHRQKKK